MIGKFFGYHGCGINRYRAVIMIHQKVLEIVLATLIIFAVLDENLPSERLKAKPSGLARGTIFNVIAIKKPHSVLSSE